MLSKNRKIAGWVLAGLIAALLLFSAYGKFAMPEMAANFEKWGLGNWRIIVACGEIIAALLFLFPRTNIFGVLLLSAHMGGAIVVHMSNAEPFIIQSVILVLVWITGFVRNPFMQAALH
ncbi:MAG: DoxX family protein [Flavobacterium lindanitolerans]|uniref:DoxX family protein n=1 Tax=Flavobacterium lindanitolerans TaxID=428988 RepID=UPI001A3983B1|nr:DoxX family protein [Flavobacterium lindanitolerans]MBL7869947.1 DoxX family protein [Flavobacterium lindanitolerans]